MKMSSASLLVCVVVAGLVVLLGDRVEGKVDYVCKFGPMISSETDQGPVHFCQTGMYPPYMGRGEYIVARDFEGICYECVCEDSFGMACCELNGARRRSCGVGRG